MGPIFVFYKRRKIFQNTHPIINLIYPLCVRRNPYKKGFNPFAISFITKTK